MINRIITGVRVQGLQSTALATFGTAAATLLIIPAFEVLAAVLLGADLRAPNPVHTAYAASLVATALAVMNGMVAGVVADRSLGVFELVHRYRRIDASYWLIRALVPVALSAGTGVVTLGLTVAIAGTWADAGWLFGLLIWALLLGAGMGVGAAGIGVSLPDPFLGATLASVLAPVLAGVIVPVTLFPKVLAWLGHAVPMVGAVQIVRGGDIAAGLATDALAACAWVAVGLAFTVVGAWRLRQGKRRQAL